MQMNRKERLVLFSGIIILLLGLSLLVYSYRGKKDDNISEEKLHKLLKQLDTAQPRFEIGYAMVNMDFYRENEKRTSSNDPDLSTFPVFKNEITARIEADSPAIKPDYSKMKVGRYFKEFSSLYKKDKLTHQGTGVICLIVKQVGAGRSDSVTLDVDRVAIRDVEEMYDALNLGANEYDTVGVRKTYNDVQKRAFRLKTMETGSSILVPLCITNIYACVNCEIDPSAWQLTSYIAYVPLMLTFRNRLGKPYSITLSKNLMKPIYMFK